MNLPELLHSLTVAGLRLSIGQGDTLQVTGDIAKLTPELKQSLSQHKPSLLSLLCCIPPADAEREAIQFADTPEGKAALPKAIDAWQKYTNANHFAFVQKRIREAKSIAELDAFELRFNRDCQKYETYKPIADAVLELIQLQRSWFAKQMLYNETSGQDNANASSALTNPFVCERN